MVCFGSRGVGFICFSFLFFEPSARSAQPSPTQRAPTSPRQPHCRACAFEKGGDPLAARPVSPTPPTAPVPLWSRRHSLPIAIVRARFLVWLVSRASDALRRRASRMDCCCGRCPRAPRLTRWLTTLHCPRRRRCASAPTRSHSHTTPSRASCLSACPSLPHVTRTHSQRSATYHHAATSHTRGSIQLAGRERRKRSAAQRSAVQWRSGRAVRLVAVATR